MFKSCFSPNSANGRLFVSVLIRIDSELAQFKSGKFSLDLINTQITLVAMHGTLKKAETIWSFQFYPHHSNLNATNSCLLWR